MAASLSYAHARTAIQHSNSPSPAHCPGHCRRSALGRRLLLGCPIARAAPAPPLAGAGMGPPLLPQPEPPLQPPARERALGSTCRRPCPCTCWPAHRDLPARRRHPPGLLGEDARSSGSAWLHSGPCAASTSASTLRRIPVVSNARPFTASRLIAPAGSCPGLVQGRGRELLASGGCIWVNGQRAGTAGCSGRAGAHLLGSRANV